MKKRLINWLHGVYTSLTRPHKRLLLTSIDTFFFVVAVFGAFSLRFSSMLLVAQMQNFAWQSLLLILIKIFVFRLKGMYRPIIRYTGLELLSTATQAVLYSSGTQVIIAYLQGSWPLPRSVLIIDALLTLVFVVGVRLSIFWLFRQLRSGLSGNTCLKFVIYGAGVAGSQLARTLVDEPECRLIAFVDDHTDIQYQIVQGIRVYSPADLPKLLIKKPFDTIILAMPSISKTRRRQIINQLQTLPVVVKTIPTLGELLSNSVSISEIRHIDVTELLGREEVMPDLELLRMNVTGKSVLVTGAGGSIGSELCRQIARLEPKCLVLYEIGEFSLYSIDMELAESHPSLNRVAYLGNVTDGAQLIRVLERHKIDTIYHTAAYKHVPIVEANPAQGIYNNVFGTLTVARCAIACGVSNFVLISTDKAVRPTNVMGASKRIAELVVQALAEQPRTPTRFAIVRFGNVLDSSGSVVPRFRQQIAQGKPITVTHREVTRYFMSIPEAVRLVIQAGAMATGGEIFLLDMGEPLKIYDLAVQMVRLSGLVPNQDIEIKITGLRPGEKLYEELLIDGDNIQPTKHSKIFSAYESKMSWEDLQPHLNALYAEVSFSDRGGIIEQIRILVPEYQPQAPSRAASWVGPKIRQ